ncbi:hypothetical protein FRB94_006036 [Tulasnella sp. JGI-2019a]|nr:hypothetical protein FRB94_006036 [Tulasnella sp. JGI-2019a]
MTSAGEKKINEAIRLLIEATQEASSVRINAARVELTGERQIDATTKLRSIITRLNRAWNHTRPLYQLPLEILITILSLVLQDEVSYAPIYMWKLQNIASVSHEWLLLVKNTPSFWKVVSTNLQSSLLKQILSRSTGHPLDVSYSWKTHDDIPIDQFTALVVPHVLRWQSLSVCRDHKMDKTFKVLVRLSAPTLEVLDIQNASWQTTVDIFSGGKTSSLPSWQTTVGIFSGGKRSSVGTLRIDPGRSFAVTSAYRAHLGLSRRSGHPISLNNNHAPNLR